MGAAGIDRRRSPRRDRGPSRPARAPDRSPSHVDRGSPPPTGGTPLPSHAADSRPAHSPPSRQMRRGLAGWTVPVQLRHNLELGPAVAPSPSIRGSVPIPPPRRQSKQYHAILRRRCGASGSHRDDGDVRDRIRPLSRCIRFRDLCLPRRSRGGRLRTAFILLPGKGALATYSPPVDSAGNSVRGQLVA